MRGFARFWDVLFARRRRAAEDIFSASGKISPPAINHTGEAVN